MVKFYAMIRKYIFVQIIGDFIFVGTKTNEGKVHIFLTINLFIRKKTPGHSIQQFNTHDHFGKFIYLSVKLHILENIEPLASG